MAKQSSIKGAACLILQPHLPFATVVVCAPGTGLMASTLSLAWICRYTRSAAAYDAGQQCGDQGAGEHRDLHVLFARVAGAERKLADQQRDGESETAEHGQADHVGPAQPLVETGAGEVVVHGTSATRAPVSA
jgi:hypothetical protein